MIDAGRDDRVVASWGRESRHPYLDETLMALVRALPLRFVCDLNAPPGSGDKRILRLVCTQPERTHTHTHAHMHTYTHAHMHMQTSVSTAHLARVLGFCVVCISPALCLLNS